jgi:hypothetical protein
MSNFKKKVMKLSNLVNKVDVLLNDLTEQVKEHLGEYWYVTTDRGDGILLGSPDAYNYRIATYFEAMKMPREDAIAYIEARGFN